MDMWPPLILAALGLFLYYKLKEEVMITKGELVAHLKQVSTLLDEVKSESEASVASIARLEALLAEVQGIPQEVIDAVEEVAAKVRAAADVVKNVPTPPVDTPAPAPSPTPAPPADDEFDDANTDK